VGDNGRIRKGLLLIVGWSFLGGLLGAATWISYYIWWEQNLRYVTIFSMAAGIGVALFLAYLCFIKFMERP
jgi:hypothetical protein